MLVLPRLVGNKGGGGKQIDFKGEDSRPANNETGEWRSPSLPPSLPPSPVLAVEQPIRTELTRL